MPVVAVAPRVDVVRPNVPPMHVDGIVVGLRGAATGVRAPSGSDIAASRFPCVHPSVVGAPAVRTPSAPAAAVHSARPLFPLVLVVRFPRPLPFTDIFTVLGHSVAGVPVRPARIGIAYRLAPDLCIPVGPSLGASAAASTADDAAAALPAPDRDKAAGGRPCAAERGLGRVERLCGPEPVPRAAPEHGQHGEHAAGSERGGRARVVLAVPRRHDHIVDGGKRRLGPLRVQLGGKGRGRLGPARPLPFAAAGGRTASVSSARRPHLPPVPHAADQKRDQVHFRRAHNDGLPRPERAAPDGPSGGLDQYCPCIRGGKDVPLARLGGKGARGLHRIRPSRWRGAARCSVPAEHPHIDELVRAVAVPGSPGKLYRNGLRLGRLAVRGRRHARLRIRCRRQRDRHRKVRAARVARLDRVRHGRVDYDVEPGRCGRRARRVGGHRDLEQAAPVGAQQYAAVDDFVRHGRIDGDRPARRRRGRRRHMHVDHVL